MTNMVADFILHNKIEAGVYLWFICGLIALTYSFIHTYYSDTHSFDVSFFRRIPLMISGGLISLLVVSIHLGFDLLCKVFDIFDWLEKRTIIFANWLNLRKERRKERIRKRTSIRNARIDEKKAKQYEKMIQKERAEKLKLMLR